MLNTLRKLGILPRTPTGHKRSARTRAGRAPIESAQFTDTPMLMEELEPRILHSADLSLAVIGGDALTAQFDGQLLEHAAVPAAPAPTTQDEQASKLELIFVDTATPDYQSLLSDIASQSVNHSFEVVLLDSDGDGIQQITDTLAARDNVSAIHVISHGSDGAVHLGQSVLDADFIANNSDQLAGWGASLTDEADILIYGCDVAQSDTGRDFLRQLSTVTGADVAGSDDLTGHTSLGGDWELEYHIGDIDNTITFTAQAWHGVLATFTVDTFNDTIDANPGDGLAQDASGFTSLRAAIMEANALAGADTIDLAAGTYTLAIAGTNENAAAQGDLDITSEIKITGAGAGATIIDGGGLDRVFDVRIGADASVTGVTIQNGGNVAQGGGIMLSGGGSGAQLTLEQVIVSGNSASSEGGGIYNDGVLTITNSEFSGNNTAPLGGALFNSQDAILTGVTISGNNADFGGGIYNSNQGNTLSLTNVTVSGNTATSQGGGIFTSKSANLTNVTVAFNSASAGGGIFAFGGQGDAVLANTILADNTGGNANKALTSSGNNIDTDGSSGLPVTLSSDLKLDPTLADNGGPTKTHALLLGSVAIDAANPSTAPAFDQRAYGRATSPDIGAEEFNAAPPGGAFWLTTEKDVASPSGAPGLDSWLAGDVLEFGDPNLTLAPAVTNGTFSVLFNMDAWASGAVAFDAIHYVRSSVTVGGSNSVTLLPGDVLLSTVVNETLTSSNSISVDNADLFVFRPDTAGDFSSGTFIQLLDESSLAGPDNWASLEGVSLVERDTVVGDTTLAAGSFIMVGGSAGNREDIYLFTPSDVGEGTTAGTKELLIVGADIGLTKGIDALELIENTIIVGGSKLIAGSILISVGGDATIEQDISQLQVTTTTRGSGTSAATIVLLLDGSDVGLDTNDENIEALTFVATPPTANIAPALTTFAAPIDATSEDTEVEITMAELAAQGDEADPDGTVNAFVIKAVSTGTLKIGATAGTATAWVAGSNDTVDAANNAYWTPASNANGVLNAFTVVARDNGGAESPTPVRAQVTVSAVDDTPGFVSSGPFSVDENAAATTVVATVQASDADFPSGGTGLIITEIMYDPASGEPAWEWLEIYNPTLATIDLAGYVLDDINSIAHAAANIAAGSITAGTTAVLFNSDSITAADFEAAWGAGLNLIPVAGWTNLQLNNDGDTVSLWTNFADYSGDHQTHANAAFTISYDDLSPWPEANAASSIYLTDLSADPADPVHWALSSVGSPTPLGGTAYQSTLAAGNSGTDVGSPGDGGPGPVLTYAITANVNPDGDGNPAFSIDAGTGVITVNDQGDLDYEATPSLAITVEVTDGISPTSTSVTINLNNVNEAPSVTAPASIAVTEDVASALTGISVADVDAAAGSVVATFSVAQGALAATTGGGVTVGGTATDLTLTGTVSDINAFISASNLTYTTALNDTSAVTLDVSVNDQGNTGGPALSSPVSSVTLNVTAVNDAPSVSAPASIAVTEDVATTITGISVADVDAAAGSVVATFSVAQGTLAATSGAGVTVGGSATNLTLTGTLTDINSFISASNLTYTTALNDTSAVTLDVSINDGGNTGGAALTSPVSSVTLNVTAVNDAPTGTVNITGTPTEDQVLTAGNTLADADGLGIVSYQWQRNGVDITGATSGTYTLTDADVGANITVVASYTDGEGNVENVTSAAVGPIANINDAPTGTANTVSVAQDSAYTFGASDFGFSDALDSPANNLLAVRITTLPAAGTLTNNGIAVGAGQFVSAADIGAGRLVFAPDAGASGAGYASFTFQVQDDGGGADLDGTARAMTVNVNAAIVSPPVITPPPTVEPPAPEPEPEPEPAPAPEPEPTEETAEVVPAGSGGGAVPLDTVLGTTQSSDTTPPPLRETAEPQSTRASRITAAGTSFDFRSFAQQLDTTLNNVAFVVTPTMPLPSFGTGFHGVEASDFLNELDTLRDSLEEQSRQAGALVTSNFVVTAGLSVGYLFWLLRAEVLLGSFLSSLPAWRLVDPLPVLGRLTAEDGEEDDESLESLVERKNRDAHATDMQDIELA